MRQNLFHIPDQIGNIPVFGIGLLLVLWVVFSVALISWLARRQGFNPDTLGYLPMIVIVTAAILFVLPGLVEQGQGLPIRSYGLMMMLGIVGGVMLAARRAPAAGIPPDAVYSFAVWLCIGGLAGARLFHIIEYWQTSYLHLHEDGSLDMGDTLAAMLSFHKGGLVVYGSFIGGMLAFVWYMRRHRLPALAFADLIAPSMMLGLALGRIGCLLNGCCFGGACELPWSVTFPQDSPPYMRQLERGLDLGLQILPPSSPSDQPQIVWASPELEQVGFRPGQVIVRVGSLQNPTPQEMLEWIRYARSQGSMISIETALGQEFNLDPAYYSPPPRSLPIGPTQIYSAINAILICLFLLAFHPYRRRDGMVFGLLITIYPVTRILLEMIRIDEAPMFGTGLSISQIISVVMLASVVLFWVFLLRTSGKKLWAVEHGIAPSIPGDPK
ncbi:MAG: prolipoprotein diacylglyceryl transferase [Planctomycetales bacterium]